jgi:hypothetical protein
MALNGVGVSALIGRAVPLAFILAAAGALIGLLAGGKIRVATRTLPTIEGIAISLIVPLVIFIFVKLIGGPPRAIRAIRNRRRARDGPQVPPLGPPADGPAPDASGAPKD